MYDFFRTACCVPKTAVADADGNTGEILAFMEQCALKKVDAAIFPELSLCGYTCADLFFQEELLRSITRNIGKIAKATRDFDGITVAGAPVFVKDALYNCALVFFRGKICGIVPKTFLPNTAEFYEKRWFSSGASAAEREISASLFGLDEEPVPFGTDLLFDLGGKALFGIEICEDLWAPVAPSAYLAMNGAEMIFNLSASNETIAKREYRRELVIGQSARLICGYAYASAGEDESTTDLVFSGHSLIAENGRLIAENKGLLQNDPLTVGDIDLEKIRADRKKIKTFHDAAALYGNRPYRTIKLPEFQEKSDGSLHPLKKYPFVPSSESHRRKRCLDIFTMQAAGLKKRLSVTGCRPVVGVSGGLDSTLALLVAVRAVQQLGRPASDVIGITMPGFGTTGRTHQNSLKLMSLLGVTAEEIGIADACRLHYRDIGQDEKNRDLTYENAQARERTQILMDYAGKTNGLVVGTGDLSELALGWCTYNADHMSMYGVNASIPKTLIRWMIESLAEYDIFAESTKVLRDILDTPISPELLPPDKNGTIAQQTEQIVGPYALHDFFLYYALRYGFSPEKIFFLAYRAFDGEFSREEILKWLKNFYRRFFTQQFKRSCLPDGVKVGSVCLSPRGDWRMPSDASAALWLKAADLIQS